MKNFGEIVKTMTLRRRRPNRIWRYVIRRQNWEMLISQPVLLSLSKSFVYLSKESYNFGHKALTIPICCMSGGEWLHTNDNSYHTTKNGPKKMYIYFYKHFFLEFFINIIYLYFFNILAYILYMFRNKIN